MAKNGGILIAFTGLLLVGCGRQQTAGTPEGHDDSTSASVTSTEYVSSAFETPVRLMAGEEFVSVESPGYACPTMADVDGDGKDDLVVGQFSQGHMQFCKNIAADDASPQFAAATWLKTGDERAIVPGVW